jgi:hypothetical protein
MSKLLMALLMGISLNANATLWYYISETKTDELYIDLESVETDGSRTKTFWVKSQPKDAKLPYETYRDAISCTRKRITVVFANNENIEMEWTPIPPDSVADHWFHFLCDDPKPLDLSKYKGVITK